MILITCSLCGKCDRDANCAEDPEFFYDLSSKTYHCEFCLKSNDFVHHKCSECDLVQPHYFKKFNGETVVSFCKNCHPIKSHQVY